MIKDTLKSAIRSLSSTYEMTPTDLRIKIDKPEGSLRYEIMNKKEIIDRTNVATALNLSSPVAFLVGNKLNSIIESLSKQHNVPIDKINVRIYTKTEDCEPLLYLFDGITPKQPLELDNYI